MWKERADSFHRAEKNLIGIKINKVVSDVLNFIAMF